MRNANYVYINFGLKSGDRASVNKIGSVELKENRLNPDNIKKIYLGIKPS